jgi:hypothetical protein
MVAVVSLLLQEHSANSNHPWANMNTEANSVVPSNLFIYKPTERELRNFWKKVDKNGPEFPQHAKEIHGDLGNCWMWNGAKKSGGYGSFWICNKVRSLHRAAYLIYHRVVDENLEVMHLCDRRLCVSEHHLVQGTTRDNIWDCLMKKRHVAPKGEKCNLSALTEAQVLEIRAKYAAGGITQVQLAAEYRIVQSGISSILRRETWKHI